MASDIKLENDWIVFKGSWAKFQTLDIMLDSPSRRKNRFGYRRALVHNYNDGLTINYNNDYPDGVEIRGVIKNFDNLKFKDPIYPGSINTKDLKEAFKMIVTDAKKQEEKIKSLERKIAILEGRRGGK